MTLGAIDIAIVALYFVGMAVLGVFVRRGQDFDDFTVARRSVPAGVVFATLAATFIGPGYSLGLTGKGATSGFFFLLPFMMFSLQTILVGRYLAPRLHELKECHSLGDVMSHYYGTGGRIATGLVSAGLCLGFVAVMARAGGVVVSEALGVSLVSGVILITGVGTLYALTGGLRAVIATDAVQFGLVLVIFSILGVYVASHVDSWEVLQASALDATSATFTKMSGADIVALCLSFLLGEALIPPYANRALAADSAQTSTRSFTLAGAFSGAWFLFLVILGFAAAAILPSELGASGDEVLVSAARYLLPEGLWGLFIVGVAAVVMSSQESVMNAGAVSATRDLLLVVKPNMGDRAQLRSARFATLLLGLGGIVVALKAPSIIGGLLICYSLWAPSVLPSLVWGLLGMPTNRHSGTLSMVGGATAAGIGLAVFGTEALLAPLGLGFSGAILGALVGLVTSRLFKEGF